MHFCYYNQNSKLFIVKINLFTIYLCHDLVIDLLDKSFNFVVSFLFAVCLIDQKKVFTGKQVSDIVNQKNLFRC